MMKQKVVFWCMAITALALFFTPAAALAGTFTALGTVTDVDGNPVRGANVTLFDDSYRELATTTSDLNGNFVFTGVPYDKANLVKVKISLLENGRLYQTELQNVLWYDVSTGVVKFNVNDTRLYSYPLSEYGYLWGIVADSQNYGLNSTVHISNGSASLSTQSSDRGAFCLQVLAGTYKVYAVHPAGSYVMISKTVEVNVPRANTYTESPAITLVVDQVKNAVPVTTPASSLPCPTPVFDAATPGAAAAQESPGSGQNDTGDAVNLPALGLALLAGLALIAAGWSVLWRKK
jgi:hypothetical protein